VKECHHKDDNVNEFFGLSSKLTITKYASMNSKKNTNAQQAEQSPTNALECFCERNWQFSELLISVFDLVSVNSFCGTTRIKIRSWFSPNLWRMVFLVLVTCPVVPRFPVGPLCSCKTRFLDHAGYTIQTV